MKSWTMLFRMLIFSMCGCGFLLGKEKEEKEPLEFSLLIVVDNSTSMRDESIQLADVLGDLGAHLASDTVYRMAITSTDVDYTSSGPTNGIDPGEAGSSFGDGTIISSESDTAMEEMQKLLLCEGTYWERNILPSDPDYSCGEPMESITSEYLDCICENNWEGNVGSGNEEPLEAALLFLCRASENPPESCNDPISPLTAEDYLSNDGFLFPDQPVVVLVIGDEGDNSRRLEQGEQNPETYRTFFDTFGFPIHVSAIGPDFNSDSGVFGCNSGGATTWQVSRLQAMAQWTMGLYFPIEIKVDTQDDGGSSEEDDADGDGVPDYWDCDDGDASINQYAFDIPGDGVDQNCDGCELQHFSPYMHQLAKQIKEY